MRPNQSRGVAAYLLFTFALSSVFYFLIAKSGQVGGGWGAYIGCLMWCPGVAALLSCKYLGRDLSTLGWKWGKTRYELACYLIEDFLYRSLPNATALLRLPSFRDSSGPCGTIQFFFWQMATVAARRFGTTCHCLHYCCRPLASYGPG